MDNIRISIVHKAMLAAADPEMPFAPPTISKLFLPVTSQSKLIRPQVPPPSVPAPAQPRQKPAPSPSLAEKLRVAARRAWINYRHDRLCAYEMSQAILRECGGRRDFTKPRWVGQQMRRGQALERLVFDGYLEPGMVLWFSNAPGADPNRLDPRCSHFFYTCVGFDERLLPEFAGDEGERISYETVTERLRLNGCALDRAFPFVGL